MMAQAVKVRAIWSTTNAAAASTKTRTSWQELQGALRLFQSSSAPAGPMRQVYEQIAQVAHTNTTALIRGESGTGKELIAHAIHYNSPRAQQAVHQGELRGAAGNLIESELFGYEKGAFTGAHAAQERPLRAGRRRHAVSRRDRRHQPRDAGKAAARAAGTRIRALGGTEHRSRPTCG